MGLSGPLILEPVPEPFLEPPHGPPPVPSLDAAAATIPDLSFVAAVGKIIGFRLPLLRDIGLLCF